MLAGSEENAELELRDRAPGRFASRQKPPSPGVKKLSGEEDLWRLRVGDYRVIYRISDRELIVLVVRVRHRSEAYR